MSAYNPRESRRGPEPAAALRRAFTMERARSNSALSWEMPAPLSETLISGRDNWRV